MNKDAQGRWKVGMSNIKLKMRAYRKREEAVRDASHVVWPSSPSTEVAGGDRWEGRVTEIHEGGAPFGSSTAVLKVGRASVDVSEDVPGISPSDENFVFESSVVPHKGQKLYSISGELWRSEWVNPVERSPRIRWDKLPPSVFFITDASGTRESQETLEDSGRWLWFRPDVIMGLAHRRGGGLEWYTRHTGCVRCSPDSGVVFGVNNLLSLAK